MSLRNIWRQRAEHAADAAFAAKHPMPAFDIIADPAMPPDTMMLVPKSGPVNHVIFDGRITISFGTPVKVKLPK